MKVDQNYFDEMVRILDAKCDKNEFEIDSVKLTYPEFFPQPIYGRLKDRITKEFDSSTVDYPQFFSYDKNFEFNKNIASNVKCKGGFIPGINKCEEYEYLDGMCEIHYKEFKAEQEKKESQKRAEIERKMKFEAEVKNRNNRSLNLIYKGCARVTCFYAFVVCIN
jgi:hypothetical protein